MRVRAAFFAVVLLAASTSLAQAGTGRVSVTGGWRYTPNDFFLQTARAQGLGIRQNAGGPQLTGTFAYAASEGVEVAIDLFAGYESIGVQGYDAIRSLSYGALIGPRAFWRIGALTPNLGVGVGPMLVNISGGVAGSMNERVTTGYAAVGGVTWQLSETFGIGLDVRLLLARGFLNGVGGINAGGIWAGLGASWFFPPEVSREGAVR